MRYVAPIVLLPTILLLAGCARAPVDDASASSRNASATVAVGAPQACGQAQVVVGIDANGTLVCKPFALVAYEAEHQEFPPPVPLEDTKIKLLGVYVTRNSTASDPWDVNMHLQMAAMGLPIDMKRVVLHFSDGSVARDIAFGDSPLPPGASASPTFGVTWIRGSGLKEILVAGDLVDIHFNLVDRELPPRLSVALQLVPQTGEPVDASFKTPATYGSDLVITVR